MNKSLFFLAFAAALGTAPAHAAAPDSKTVFFDQLKALCGATFEGKSVFSASANDDFAGKKLVANFSGCGASEMRVPFIVGADTSRTWIFTRSADALTLQHDHRHADGTPDEQTMYGGAARAGGTALAQSFAADSYTARLIPAAATNVWTVSLSQDGTMLTYFLERDGKPRFKAMLQRVAAPAR